MRIPGPGVPVWELGKEANPLHQAHLLVPMHLQHTAEKTRPAVGKELDDEYSPLPK